MGAWDVGSFENDTALDFVAEVEGTDDLLAAFAALGPGDLSADADQACEAIAAADLVAAMMGRPAPDIPRGVADRVVAFGPAGDELIAAAVGAVRHVRANSELAELWAEAEDEDWPGAIDDLLQRLDPAVPYAPPPPRDEAIEGEVSGICLICDGTIPAEEIVTVTLEEEDDIVASSLTLYAHRACLEKNFDPPHFAEDGSPHPDLLARVKAHLNSRT
ncbi:MAG: DUF4259 domain-containing protein [Alphaproteobacteria bacterium]|nr:DUF4259 domain-containing protein [Alphaproteobacteria bacterium]